MEKSSLKLRILPFIYVGIVLIVGYLFISSILKINYNNKHKKDVEVTTIEDTVVDDSNGIFNDGSNGSITIDDVTDQDDSSIIEDNNDKKPTTDDKLENKTITATSISLNKNSTTISVGGSEQLYASLTPKDVTNKNISWITNNSKVATVSNGVVKGVSEGVAVITVKSSNGKTATCKVNVYKNKIAVKSISLNKNNITIYAGSTYQLKASTNPNNATNQKIRWTSSNSKVAVVSSTGKVGGKNAGTATIKAISEDGNKVAECKVTVKTNNTTTNIPVTNVGVTPSSYSITVGGKLTLKAIITPSNATNKNLTWSSSNNSVATVNSSGIVTGKSSGTARITVRTANGKTASCTITVKTVLVSSVSMTKSVSTLAYNKTYQFAASVSPSNANNKSLLWASSSTSVASVNTTGLVKCVGVGTSTITAKAKDGSGKSASVKLTCNATGLTLNKTTATVKVGSSITLTATPTPSTATVSWKRNNSYLTLSASSGKSNKITCKSAGKTTVTASVIGQTKTATITCQK